MILKQKNKSKKFFNFNFNTMEDIPDKILTLVNSETCINSDHHQMYQTQFDDLKNKLNT